MVKISPCAEIAARWPEGDRLKLSASLLLVRTSKLFSLPSVAISIFTSLDLPEEVSSFQRPPSSSKTMTLPSEEIEGKKSEPSRKCVNCVGLPPLSATFQRLLADFMTSREPALADVSRAETKKISLLPY